MDTTVVPVDEQTRAEAHWGLYVLLGMPTLAALAAGAVLKVLGRTESHSFSGLLMWVALIGLFQLVVLLIGRTQHLSGVALRAEEAPRAPQNEPGLFRELGTGTNFRLDVRRKLVPVPSFRLDVRRKLVPVPSLRLDVRREPVPARSLRRLGSRGGSLTAALIATFVLSVAMLLALQAYYHASAALTRTTNRSRALMALESQAEVLRAAGFAALPEPGRHAIPAETLRGLPGAGGSLTVKPGPTPGMRQVSLEVTWQEGDGPPGRTSLVFGMAAQGMDA